MALKPDRSRQEPGRGIEGLGLWDWGQTSFLGPRADRGRHALDRRHISAQLHIDEHRHRPILNDRIDGRRKSGSHGNHLVARLHAARAQRRRSQRAHRHQIRRRAGVDQQRRVESEPFSQQGFELFRIPAGSQPEIQTGVHGIDQLLRVEYAARIAHGALSGNELPLTKRCPVVFGDQSQNLLTLLFAGQDYQPPLTADTISTFASSLS